MRLLLVVALALGACSHGGNVPLGAPDCITDSHVQPCAGYPKRDGVACATCDDANFTLSCQVDTGRDYLYAVCVASCDSCATDPAPGDASSSPSIHLCSPARYRESSWCATCDDLNASLATVLCDRDGFCDPVVCVADCAACELEP